MDSVVNCLILKEGRRLNMRERAGGGMNDPDIVRQISHANAACFAAFSVFGVLGGTICNRLGIRHTLYFPSSCEGPKH